jgi:hypothetical protein
MAQKLPNCLLHLSKCPDFPLFLRSPRSNADALNSASGFGEMAT